MILHELNLIATRYTNFELGMFITMHMRKAETIFDETIRRKELESARVYHEVLGHKISMLENV